MLSGIFNNIIIITEIDIRFYLVIFIERMQRRTSERFVSIRQQLISGIMAIEMQNKTYRSEHVELLVFV